MIALNRLIKILIRGAKRSQLANCDFFLPNQVRILEGKQRNSYPIG
ncbi:hypothetical protein CWATWH0005_5666 [Crocosphaera watsonii WH 0005]|uniref:Uncharacterized protein n=1 Tax=Crocosphaera watsonii WH 0005 TaxID=423472 RepID=T2IYS2_CROWT|nr:hypothetical protein CWATWH0005_5666 [Crocosphaera watsonii WH 0005]